MDELLPSDTPSTEEIYIFNPTKEDFTHSCALLDGVSRQYTLKSYEGRKFPKVVADHLAKHLKDKIVGDMNGVITELQIEKAYKSIYLT